MNTSAKNPLQVSIETIGPYKLAELVGLRGPSIYKWLQRGQLPRTEWTGETNYAAVIVDAMGGKVTRAQLLQLTAPPEA